MKLIDRVRQKVKFEWSFWRMLIAILVIVFLASHFLLSEFFEEVQKSEYQVTTEDEKDIYGGFFHDYREDFSLLDQRPPSKLSGIPSRLNPNEQIAIAVVVENYTPIRSQQDGLEEAAIVYESLAEGGITRLLAIYTNDKVDKIGPVRSARPYFITWASELRAPFVHVGGSPAALANLAGNFRVLNIDEFSDSKTIWRDNDYLAPHNAYTSTSKILKRLKKEKYSHPLSSSRFPFKEEKDEFGDIKNISIDYSIKPYKVRYEFDEADGKYARFNGGDLHHEIKPTNIIIQYADHETLDDIGRQRIQTHGAGNALVFRDGKVIEGTWEKDASINSDDQLMSESWTKFFDQEGNEIELNPGQTWIQIVPTNLTVNYF